MRWEEEAHVHGGKGFLIDDRGFVCGYWKEKLL